MSSDLATGLIIRIFDLVDLDTDLDTDLDIVGPFFMPAWHHITTTPLVFSVQIHLSLKLLQGNGYR